MEDKAIKAIVEQQAADLARQIEDENDGDLLPWGGKFSSPDDTKKRNANVAVASTGEC